MPLTLPLPAGGAPGLDPVRGDGGAGEGHGPEHHHHHEQRQDADAEWKPPDRPVGFPVAPAAGGVGWPLPGPSDGLAGHRGAGLGPQEGGPPAPHTGRSDVLPAPTSAPTPR